MSIFGGEIENKFELINPGRYLGFINKVTEKTSKAGNKFIQIEFVLENNRKLWDNLHWHTPKCIDISKGKLASIGFTKEERDALSPETLLTSIISKKEGQNYEINVGVKKSEDFGDQNIIKSFKLTEKDPF